MKVWVAEEGEYEQRYIEGIYASFEGAVACIKQSYGKPYIVTWKQDKGGLTGDFEEVNNYSIKHTARIDITPMEVRAFKEVK